MQTTYSPNMLHQDCLNKLQKILDLAMQTAEAASTEGNHKIVLQAVREVTRIITLMTKLAGAPAPEVATSIPAAPITTKTPVQADQKSDIEELTNGLVQDVLKIFPGLVSNLEPANPEPKSKTVFSGSGKKAGNYRKKPLL
jgi:hypothetical protein